MGKTRNTQKRSPCNKRKNNKSRRSRKGGTKKGMVETAVVPFGLFALQHLASRNNKKMKKRKTLKKGKRKNKFRMRK